jgi:hypothetical protein
VAKSTVTVWALAADRLTVNVKGVGVREKQSLPSRSWMLLMLRLGKELATATEGTSRSSSGHHPER